MKGSLGINIVFGFFQSLFDDPLLWFCKDSFESYLFWGRVIYQR